MARWFNNAGTANAFNLVGNGWTPNRNIYLSGRHQLYHRIDVPSDGSTEFKFFNVIEQTFISNLPMGKLDDETGVWLSGLSISIETGRNVAGVADAGGGDQVVAGSTAIDLAEWLREMIDGGLVTLVIGDRRYVQDYGVKRFPASGGANLAGGFGVTTTASATTIQDQALMVNNGVPHTDNRYSFRPLIPLLPGKRLSLTIKYPVAIAPPSDTSAVIMCEFDGMIVKPSNL